MGVTTDYLSGFQYKNGILQFFPHAEGYVNATATIPPFGGEVTYDFNYVYNYTDHLGNIRLSYSVDPASQEVKIMEENHYYPFGLKHTNYNSDWLIYGRQNESTVLKKPEPIVKYEPVYKYKYNGKEYQDELGLNMYDYGARNYDPALGRWMNIDPLAEKGRRWSLYIYAMNNSIYFTDPDGMLSQSFIDNMWNKSGDGETKWTNNDNGSFSSNSGENISTNGDSSNSNQQTRDPKPKSKSIWEMIKSIFTWKVSSKEESEDKENATKLFYKSTDKAIEVGEAYQDAITIIFPLPSNPSGKIKATGWIIRKAFTSLDSSLQKKFIEAVGKGVVSPTGKQGIIKLTTSEAKAVGAGYTHKLKILGKGGDIRIYGKQLDNGHFVFDKILGH